jgi:hypothetical protein
MFLITDLNEGAGVVSEASTEGKDLYIEGTFMQYDTLNKNGRIYPREVMLKELQRYINEKVKFGNAYGELDHPSGPKINADRISHRVVELADIGNGIIRGKAKVQNTPMGNVVRGILEDDGARVGVSSRALGSLQFDRSKNANIVQEDFYIVTAGDVVIDPSAPAAFVDGIMEGKQWVWENGLIMESEIDSIYNRVKNAKSHELDEVMSASFKDFLSKL